MTSSIAPEISLYDFVVQTMGTAASSLLVSPNTFKGLISTLIDLLVEGAFPATIWAKLPRGESWQAELDRGLGSGRGARSFYHLRNSADESSEDGSAIAESLGEPELASSPQVEGERSYVTLQLASDSILRREFFFLIWSPEICALVIAHRERARRSPAKDPETASETEDSPEKRNQLAIVCTFEPTIIRQTLGHIETLLDGHATADTRLTPTIADWQKTLAQTTMPTGSPQELHGLFMKQLYRQEDLWQRLSVYRKQSELVDFLQLQNEELLSAVRAKDEFISTVGQELRTPLTNMKTALTLLNSPHLKPPQRQRYMDLLVKECDRQSSLIGSLLDLVSLDQMAERQTLQPISVADVVPGVVSTYQPLAEEKGVRLAYTVPEDLPPVACLNPWLRQIVVNLLHNGIKFTDRGGQVWVRAKQQGDFIQLEFKDTGIGIPVQEIPRIFDRFYRVRHIGSEDIGGAGLGLTIVQQLLLRCGGSISVKSRPMEGSIFNVMMPIYQYREGDKGDRKAE